MGKLFGQADTGGVSVTLYTTFPEDFDPQNDALFVDINSLAVPLYCDKFERRGVAGANVEFADFDTPRRVEELIGKELYMELEEERDDDEFYMQAVFLIIRMWDYTVILGNLLGAAVNVLNFFLMALTVQKAVEKEEKEAKQTMKLSHSYSIFRISKMQ